MWRHLSLSQASVCTCRSGTANNREWLLGHLSLAADTHCLAHYYVCTVYAFIGALVFFIIVFKLLLSYI